MKLSLSKVNFKEAERLEESSYLLTNGLGGYSSLTLAFSATRADHSFFMAADKFCNNRYNYIRKLDETLIIDGIEYNLTSQTYVNDKYNFNSFYSFESFSQEYLPVFTYQVDGVVLTKYIVMEHEHNTIGVKYKIDNILNKDISLTVIPKYVFSNKAQPVNKCTKLLIDDNMISNGRMKLYYKHNMVLKQSEQSFEDELYFSYDSRDGRCAVDTNIICHEFSFSTKDTRSEAYIIYSDINKDSQINTLIKKEIERQKQYIDNAKCIMPISKKLVRASEQFVVRRCADGDKTIIAGYPFFGDWGRDTMIAMLGCNIVVNQFDDAKDIFRTFIKYEKNGLLPNIFPEFQEDPRYNTIDAALLMIISLYEYYQASNDLEFIKDEAYNCMINIYKAYSSKTDYDIEMAPNGLIRGGSGLDQLTWMDVCFEGILPTARHGFAVEINALWYNTLCIIDYFNNILNIKDDNIKGLITKVKVSFYDVFYNKEKQCLYDYVCDNIANEQIRPNQSYAVGLPFAVLDKEESMNVIKNIYQHLYTPLGLRTLNINDKQFKAKHTGSHYQRDMAYHQGTVWPFMSGQFLMGILNFYENNDIMMNVVKKQFELINNALYEGCIGQVAEIYDGYIPNESRGCFAQAWSVSEMLRVSKRFERMNNNE